MTTQMHAKTVESLLIYIVQTPGLQQIRFYIYIQIPTHDQESEDILEQVLKHCPI